MNTEQELLTTTSGLPVSVPSVLDSQITYINQLKKDGLIVELSKMGLSTTGTVDTLRKRLIAYLKGEDVPQTVKLTSSALPGIVTVSTAPTTPSLTFPPTTTVTFTTSGGIPSIWSYLPNLSVNPSATAAFQTTLQPSAIQTAFYPEVNHTEVPRYSPLPFPTCKSAVEPS